MTLTIPIVKEQLKNIFAQRDNASTTFQQCIGAIAVLSEQLKMMECEEESNKEIDNCIERVENVGIKNVDFEG